MIAATQPMSWADVAGLAITFTAFICFLNPGLPIVVALSIRDVFIYAIRMGKK